MRLRGAMSAAQVLVLTMKQLPGHSLTQGLHELGFKCCRSRSGAAELGGRMEDEQKDIRH